MLALILVNTVIVVLVLFFALSLAFIFHDRNSLQSYCDAAALKNGVDLNVNGRAEQMNNLMARSRELVFISRQAAERASGSHQYLQPLAADLLMLARNGATRVLTEKKRLVHQTLVTLRTRNKTVPQESDHPLPLTGGTPRVLELAVGSMVDQTSNVLASPGNAALYSYDLGAKYVKKESNLYIPVTNLKLPGADSDLEFTLSPMPHSESSKPVQAKLARDRDFKLSVYLIKDGFETKDECLEFPSAQRITFSQAVATLDGHHTMVTASAVASTDSVGSLP
jgi:hypothetical protein